LLLLLFGAHRGRRRVDGAGQVRVGEHRERTQTKDGRAAHVQRAHHQALRRAPTHSLRVGASRQRTRCHRKDQGSQREGDAL